MGSLRPWHIAVLVVLLILLFGAKRLPDAACSLGRSMRILKTEVKGLQDDDLDSKAEARSGRQPLEGRQQVDGYQASDTPAQRRAQRISDNN